MNATISPAQQEVYDLVMVGKTPQEIAKKLGKDIGIINAQITRLRSKGVLKPEPRQSANTGKPQAVGPTSNEAVANELNKAGAAKYEIPPELKKVADKHGEVLDVHPMIVLGVTIQFVKLCGGRMHAHQVIEDVYGALRVMVGDTDTSSDQPKTTLPYAAAEQLKTLEDQLNSIKNSLRQ